MAIEHFPDPCGPGCVARGMITDTIDGREHDSCPDVAAGTVFDPVTLSPEALRAIAFRVNTSDWSAMIPIDADAAQQLTVCVFDALASLGIRFVDPRSPIPAGATH